MRLDRPWNYAKGARGRFGPFYNVPYIIPGAKYARRHPRHCHLLTPAFIYITALTAGRDSFRFIAPNYNYQKRRRRRKKEIKKYSLCAATGSGVSDFFFLFSFTTFLKIDALRAIEHRHYRYNIIIRRQTEPSKSIVSAVVDIHITYGSNTELYCEDPRERDPYNLLLDPHRRTSSGHFQTDISRV